MLGAVRAAAARVRRVRVGGNTPAATVAAALRRASLQLVDQVEAGDGEAVQLVLAADRAEARTAWKHPTGRTVVAWTDGDRHLPEAAGIHVSTKLDVPTGTPESFEHITVIGPEDDRSLPLRLADEGLWPSTPALETLRINADGSRDVRILGYLNPYAETPEDRLSLASSAYKSVALSSDPATASSLRVFARSARGKMVGPSISLTSELRAQTMADAVGSCGYRTWVTGAAVALVGKARVDTQASEFQISVAVERIESKASVANWLALAPRYRVALSAVTRAVTKRRGVSASDIAPIARVHDDIRTAYGSAASLLEIDVVLRALRSAFERGSVTEALEALEHRCRRTDEESRLYDALEALEPAGAK